MEGIVEAIIAFLSCGQVIPAVGKTNSVTVQQVELKSDIGAHTRHKHARHFITAEDGIDQIKFGSVVVHKSIARTVHQTTEGQHHFAVDGQIESCFLHSG